MLSLLCACETTLPFESQDEPVLNVNAVAVAGQELEVWVLQALPLDQGKNMYSMSYQDFAEQLMSYVEKSLLVSDATVTVSVNDSRTYNLAYDSTATCYKCDYVPQEGDRITLTASATGFETVSSTATVPQSLELTDFQHQTVYSQIATAAEHEYARSQTLGNYDTYGADSVMTLSFSFQDPSGESNYYRLKVRSVGEYHYWKRLYYTMSDAYTSADPVFYDASLTKAYADWEAYFSNVFDDHLFDGQSYRITVNSRKRDEEKNYVIVELQSISSDLYSYLKSIQVYRITTDDAYSTPVGIYSNFDNGWGILGALSAKTYIIEQP